MGGESNINPPAPIAIIGMACLFPEAEDLQAFWRNILGQVDAVGEPVESWQAERYLSTGRIKTPFGGYLKDLYRFDPREFGIMPNSLDGGEPDQYLALRVARDALADAGYAAPEVDHRDTGIILGHSTYLHRGQGAMIQNHIVLDQTVELLKATCPDLGDDKIEQIRALLRKKLPPSNTDIAPGLVPNVMTGRIANRLNLKGPNYLVDAACSSSLLAVNAAIDELRTGRSRMMLAGGVNASLPAEVAVIFTQLGALSGRGKVRPFETGSDGTLLGEGLGMVVLKKLDDALADGDRVYAVLRGVGQASDGRGQGLLAPSIEGETLAMHRAYASTGVDPKSVSLIEAHGTGIPLGDKTEIGALRNIFGTREEGAGGSKAIGSVKSMISHCIPAAGIAGLIKTSLALHHKVLPPTLCGKVNPDLAIDTTPFFVNTEAQPWIERRSAPRRAGVNSFGFGGINAHAIVEEAPPQAAKPADLTPWPAELCVFAAPDMGQLTARLSQLRQAIDAHPEWRLADVAARLAQDAGEGACRLAIVAKDMASLAKQVDQALGKLVPGAAPRWTTRGGLSFSSQPVDGQLAFLFPGEGSQYLGMLADVALCFPQVREWLDFWRSLYDDTPGRTRTDIVYPPATELDDARRQQLEQRLHDMDVGSEAVFVGGQAMHALLRSLGVVPDVMMGHSSGESSALAASGAIAADDPQQLASFIRQLNAVYQQVLDAGKIPRGALLAVGALPREAVQQQIEAAGSGIVVAMNNCANQLVLYGDRPAIEALQATLIAAGGICQILPFDRGYHTPAFDEASAAFLKYYRSVGLGVPSVPMYSCATAERFPERTAAVRQLAAAQWSTTVRFHDTVRRMQADGVRYFVEVGPSGNLSAFVNDILAGSEYVSLATNVRRRGGMEQLLATLGSLFVNGKWPLAQRLFEGRAVQAVDLSAAPAARKVAPALCNTMPTLMLDDAERAALRALLPAPAAVAPAPGAGNAGVAVAAAEAVPGIPADPDAAAAMADGPADEATGPDTGVQQVMSDYFDMMRGFLDQQRRVFEGLAQQGALAQPDPADGEDAPVEPGAMPLYVPMLDAVLEWDEQHLVAECTLDLQRDNFLRDHVLSGPVSVNDAELLGLSCVPLMVSLELMAEACALLAGRRDVGVIENVRAFDWIALDDGEVTLQVRAEAVSTSVFRATVLRDGSPVVSAEFGFDAGWRLGAVAPLGAVQPSRWAGHELYSTGMFHGPVFQSVREVAGWNGEGIEARLSPVSLVGFFAPGQAAQLVLNPVLLDALGQLIAYWLAQQVGTDFNSFPSTIERVELYRACPTELHGIVMRGRQAPLEAGNNDIGAPRAWNFECVDAQGTPLLRVQRLVNVYFPVPHRFYQVRRDPLNGWLGRPSLAFAEQGIVLWDLPHLPEDFCAQSSSVFLRILAHVYLDHDEREAWRQLQGSVRQRREWLLGRACLKEAVRHWIHERSGYLVYPSDVVVGHDEAGAPFVDGWWRDTVLPAPCVSLSHTARGSLAAVASPERGVGVDMEQVGRVQQPEHVVQSFTAAEQAIVRQVESSRLQETVLRIWCAKEAAAKLLGMGLQGQPERFEVEFVDTGLSAARVHCETTTIDVNLVHQDGTVIAVAAGQSSGVEVNG